MGTRPTRLRRASHGGKKIKRLEAVAEKLEKKEEKETGAIRS
jgi:hypothetical protein